MSDNTEQVEQITKEPSVAPKREKDPKRVAAGKKLAEKNKQMREEHARYKALESQREDETPPESTTRELETETKGDLLSQLSLTNIISLVGIGLTIYAIFFKKSGEKHAWQEPVRTSFEEPQPKTEETRKKNDESKRVPKPRPKFGM